MTDLFNIVHGVGGLWEVHQWNGDLELNVQDDIGYGGEIVRDRLVITKIAGLHSLPERPDPRGPRVGRVGENAYPTAPLGKTVTYEGEIRGTTTGLLRSQRTALLAAFADTTAEGYMDVIPQAGDSSPVGRFYGKPLSLEIDDEQTTTNGLFTRGFLLGIRLSDPRMYYPALAVNTTDAAVTNTGDAPVDPVITIASASGSVVVTDGTRTLTFAAVPSGTLVINFAARTATVAGVNVELVVADSDWWDPFVPGIAAGATVTVTQTGGASCQVQLTPATWG